MNKPKIVLWDLETLPITYEHINVLPEYNSDRYGLTLRADVNSLLCFGYKILGDSKAKCINSWDFKSGKLDINDDKDVVKAAYNILKDADGMVTHNGTGFDLKFLNTRLVLHGLPPLHKINHIDTKVVASKKLFFIRNKLDYLAQRLDTERKMENGGWKLWVRLAHSSQTGPRCPTEAQTKKDKQTMSKYCAQDVEALEQLYLKLRPLSASIPNYNLFQEDGSMSCPSCGSDKLEKHGFIITKTAKRQRYLCKSCGSTCSTDKADKNPR